MRFQYSTTSPAQNEFDSLPRLPLLLHREEQRVEAVGLVDSGVLFAWVKRPKTPLILGQTNFFLEFDVCFYRSKMEFEVKPKSP
jgi:hypothetical protein